MSEAARSCQNGGFVLDDRSHPPKRQAPALSFPTMMPGPSPGVTFAAAAKSNGGLAGAPVAKRQQWRGRSAAMIVERSHHTDITKCGFSTFGRHLALSE